MPRPKTGSTPADQRILQAFWDLRDEQPLARISVVALCDRAGINKTTFYYHFRDAQDVLDRLEDECLDKVNERVYRPALLEAARQQGSADVIRNIILGLARECPHELEVICWLLGSRGDPSFVGRMHSRAREFWLGLLGIASEDVDPRDELLLDYALAGATGLLSRMGNGEAVDIEAFANLVADVMSPQLDGVLAKYLPTQDG